MRADRLELLANDVSAFVFDQLDAEPDWTGIDAGRSRIAPTFCVGQTL
jgi:hypothetical protein